ncbi:uncharacterized protein LOC124921970 [Impatiens glandulifera]|uniref:uncharacterized protein LOC124921970 n=1 Tax=Impatiens glandulifera TaxID=253017 RepID=UPI001FB11E1B|nr:uncharacterized protein LOC124921970 [Impatiens glandulifera]
MKNTLRCCISCILPCGSLDVIRIIHANGRVEEINRSIRASEIMESYPNHILKKPSSPSDDAPKIVIVPPEAELQRGKIYFLMPAPTPSLKKSVARSETRRKKEKTNNTKNNDNLVMSDRYLSEILSEKIVSTGKDRRRGRTGVWRPHLESISETTPTSTTQVS